MKKLHLIKSPCPYCGDTGDECACREFMSMLTTMTSEEKKNLNQYLADLRKEAGHTPQQ